jgi:hypothetical protein
MRDDFSALDLFSATGKKKSVGKKKLLALSRRKAKKGAKKETLAAFTPLIAKIKKKQKSDAVDAASLQGWPVSLSWSAPRSPEREDFSHLL